VNDNSTRWMALGAVVLSMVAIVVGLTFPRAQDPPKVSLGKGIASVGCTYIRDIGASHFLPIKGCKLSLLSVGPDETATANFLVADATTHKAYTLQLKFLRALWQVTSAVPNHP
jgi:hypothetical protein